ncbi:DNA/RNA nuclease SfsA [Brockia lithotrophica]|uniref:Sugar fermentation stimulation protein homolog n=1 Tax=Brockia lithotrophica TaxID=933949 RepID=A0A660L1D0_9BACL|nr:DNA/RNA nuclease SfsA [Brockia lithotrophica]RKQ85428.1 sugar fermentation stimulation protein [Brockia lithotrophica]
MRGSPYAEGSDCSGYAVTFPPLVRARFLARPNRFLLLATGEGDGGEAKPFPVHLPDPGRLETVLFPGGGIWISPVPSDPRGKKPRKTNFRAVLAELPHGGYATVDARVAELVASWWLRCMCGRAFLERQVARGAHRFDLYVPAAYGFPPLWVEVKSVTYVLEGIGYFPDAVTERGRRHLLALAELVETGQEGALALFVVGRADARAVSPAAHIDPRFAEAFRAARQAGVRMHALLTEPTPRGVRVLGEIPVQEEDPVERSRGRKE